MYLYQSYMIIGTEFGDIFIWDLSSSPHFLKFSNQSNRIKAIDVVTLDFDVLIVSSTDGSIKIWDILKAVKEIGTFKENKDMDEDYKPIYEIQTF